jgi:hypothetical protein
VDLFRERAESRDATEAPSERSSGIYGHDRPDGVEPAFTGDVRGGEPRDSPRLGDLFGLASDPGSHLNASSSRKYAMVSPSGLMGISSFGTLDLKTNTKFAV